MLLRTTTVGLASLAAVAVLSAQSPADLAEQLRRGDAQYKDGKHSDALKSYVRAAESPDPAAAHDARKGLVRAAMRVGEFTLARRTASTLSVNDRDAEALTLSGDAL